MHQSSFSCLLLIQIFLKLFITSQAQDPLILNLYINNQALPSNLEGTEQNPFTNLLDAFNIIQNRSSPISQANIYIAPSIEVYNLSKLRYLLNGNTNSSIIISGWNSTFSDQNQASSAILDFSSSSLIFEDFALFSIQNMDIIWKGDFILLDNTNLLLHNLSMQVSPIPNQPIIKIQNGLSVRIENIELNQYTYGSLIEYFASTNIPSSEVILQNISIVIEKGQTISSPSMLALTSNPEQPTGTVIVKDIVITTENNTDSELPSILIIEGFDSVEISNISIQNESVNMEILSSVMSIKNINDLELNQLLFTNNSWKINSSKSLISLSDIVNITIKDIELSSSNITTDTDSFFNLFNISNAQSITLSNHSIYQNLILLELTLCQISSTQASSQPESGKSLDLVIKQIYLSENMNLDNSKSLIYMNLQGTTLESLAINDVEFSKNQISSHIFLLKPNNPSKEYIFDPSFTPKLFKISNIGILDNKETTNTTFLYFDPPYDQDEDFGCLQPIEAFALYVNNLTVSNNSYQKDAEYISSIYQVSLFQVKQAQFHLNSSLIYQNSFEKYNFLTLGPKPSTLIITSSQIIENVFNFSQFVAGALASEYACSYTGSEFAKDQAPLYRYMFILNSELGYNKLYSSIFISTVNGFIAFHNNIVHDEQLMNSQFLIGSSLPAKISLDSITYMRNSIVEDSTLKSNSLAQETFSEVMLKVLSYQPEGIYFTSVYRNNFTNMNLAILKLISITGFNFNQSFVAVEQNRFSIISSFNFALTSIMYFDTVKTMVIMDNTFDLIRGRSSIFTLSQIDSAQFLKINSNILNNISGPTFVTFTADSVESIEFNNNILLNSNIYSNLLYISVQTSFNDWVLSNNTVFNNSYMSDQVLNPISPPGFIALFCNDYFHKSQIVISDSSFTNMQLTLTDETNPNSQATLFLFQTYQNISFVSTKISNISLDSLGYIIQLNYFANFFFSNSQLEAIRGKGPN